MTVTENLKPQEIWEEFEAISKIPRCSKHEGKIREYLIDFAKKHNLKYDTDKVENVVIKRPASPGMENRPTIVLQSHMDMVCEKNNDVSHDFSKDPIPLTIEGDKLTAKGTTLGADNGIGVAITLAILKDKDLKLGAIEGLFTVDEETGLTGAFALEPHMLSGKIMLNIDSEDFGVITVGCAGGGDSQIHLPLTKEALPASHTVHTLTITGLRGGHSGVDAPEQRGNAIKILARLLWKTTHSHNIKLVDFQGGDKHNAIPREANAIIATDKAADVSKELQQLTADILAEIKPIDPGLKLSITDATADKCLTEDCQKTVLNLIHALPHGIDTMSYDIAGLVETSTNLATVHFKDDNVQMGLSSRSSISSALQNFRDRIRATAELAGATVEEDTPYPGWKPNLESNVLKIGKKVYKDMFGEDPVVEAIHAGLECGVIGEKFEGMDMISIGPTIKYPHSPDEHVVISTVEKFYDYTLELIKNIK